MAAAGGSSTVGYDAEETSKVDYEVQVLAPEKHGQGVGAYLTFELKTKARGGAFGEREFSVRRKWGDFQWLRSSLADSFPQALIPPLTEKEKLPAQQKHEETVVLRRTQQLQTFIFRVCQHPILSTSKDLGTFLEAKVWGLEASALGTKQVGKMLFSLGKDADSVWKKMKATYQQEVEDPEHERHQNLMNYTSKLEEQLLQVLETFKKVHKRQEGVGSDLELVLPTLEAMSQSDDEISEGLRRFSATCKASSEAWVEQCHHDDMTFTEPLKEVIVLTSSAREVLKNREMSMYELLDLKDHKLRISRELEQAKTNLNNPRQKSAFEIFRESLVLDNPKDSVPALEAKQKENLEAIANAERRWKSATEGTSAEIERYHRMRIWEMKHLLKNYSKAQVDFHRKMLAEWEAMEQSIEAVQIEDASEFQPPSGAVISEPELLKQPESAAAVDEALAELDD